MSKPVYRINSKNRKDLPDTLSISTRWSVVTESSSFSSTVQSLFSGYKFRNTLDIKMFKSAVLAQESFPWDSFKALNTSDFFKDSEASPSAFDSIGQILLKAHYFSVSQLESRRNSELVQKLENVINQSFQQCLKQLTEEDLCGRKKCVPSKGPPEISFLTYSDDRVFEERFGCRFQRITLFRAREQ